MKKHDEHVQTEYRLLIDLFGAMPAELSVMPVKPLNAYWYIDSEPLGAPLSQEPSSRLSRHHWSIAWELRFYITAGFAHLKDDVTQLFSSPS